MCQNNIYIRFIMDLEAENLISFAEDNHMHFKTIGKYGILYECERCSFT